MTHPDKQMQCLRCGNTIAKSQWLKHSKSCEKKETQRKEMEQMEREIFNESLRER